MNSWDETAESIRHLEGMKSAPSNEFLQTLFKQLRKSKMTRSDLVIKYGPTLLKSVYDEREVYNLYEQICIAALDMEEIELAEDYLVKLTKKFKSSQRVSRLQGMCLEAREQFTEALAVYDEVLKENPANSLVRKRKVAVYRAQGKNEDAVNELHSILRLFPADVPSWIELAELHASLGEYSAAAHCYEEIVLIDPRNPHAHTRLADYYVQTKDLENLVLARKHYATSLESLSPKFNSHALTGLINCCKMILGQPSAVSAAERLVTEEMLKWAQEQ